MDTVSTVGHILNTGSGSLWVLGGIALSVALTIRYSKSQSINGGNNSKGIMAGRDINAPINMSTNLPKDKSEK